MCHKEYVMKKTNKKTDNQIIKALTIVCETAKSDVNGFQWLTHFVNYNKFPDSLAVVCIFDTNAELIAAREQLKDQYISRLIKNELERIDIKVKNIRRHVSFDTEEACNAEHDGRWEDRFNVK